MSSLDGFQEAVERAIETTGCRSRGWIDPRNFGTAPELANGEPARSLVLVGVVGNGHWPAFSASAEFGDGGRDSLDRWSRRVIGSVAESFDGVAVFPFGDPPYRPFQRWAEAAEGLESSPIGILIHSTYGLWHAYRGAIAFDREIDAATVARRPPPCETCEGKPCLTACPVGSFSPGRYDVEACVGHLRSDAGVDCMAFACRARRACPVGVPFAYEPAQARFLMDAFLLARSTD